MRNVIITLLCQLLLSANAAVFEPSELAEKTTKFLDSECPNLGATYSIRGEEGQYVGVGPLRKFETTRHDVFAWIADTHPRFKEKSARNTYPQPDNAKTNSFWIVQPGLSRIEVHILAKPGTVYLLNYEQAQKDFDCVDGWVILRSQEARGYSDGAGYAFRSEFAFTRTTNGDVVYKHSLTQLGGSRPGTKDTYFRFRELK